jgi:hypothetical protein
LKVLYLRWKQSGKQLPPLRTTYRFQRSKGTFRNATFKIGKFSETFIREQIAPLRGNEQSKYEQTSIQGILERSIIGCTRFLLACAISDRRPRIEKADRCRKQMN